MHDAMTVYNTSPVDVLIAFACRRIDLAYVSFVWVVSHTDPKLITARQIV